MKRIVIALLVLMTIFSLANAQKQTTVINDSTGNVKVTVTKDKDAKTNAGNTAVTVVGMDDEDADTTHVSTSKASTPRGPHGKASISIVSDDDDFPFNNFGNAVGGGILVAIISIIAIFGMPVFIIFVVFFFRYKNRKARYRLAEQALAAGQPLPEGFIRGACEPEPVLNLLNARKVSETPSQASDSSYSSGRLPANSESERSDCSLCSWESGNGWSATNNKITKSPPTGPHSQTERKTAGTPEPAISTLASPKKKTKLSIQSQSPPPRGTKQESRRKTTKRRTKKINEPTQRYITSRTGRGVQKHQGLRPVGAKVPVACQTFLPASDLR